MDKSKMYDLQTDFFMRKHKIWTRTKAIFLNESEAFDILFNIFFSSLCCLPNFVSFSSQLSSVLIITFVL